MTTENITHLENMLNGLRQTHFPNFTKNFKKGEINSFSTDIENFTDKEDIKKLIKLYVELDETTRKILTTPSTLEKFLAIIIKPHQEPLLQA